jgi:hypothetical protein
MQSDGTYYWTAFKLLLGAAVIVWLITKALELAAQL